MANTKKLIQAAAGAAGGAGLNVEEVFSTYLYTGTGSTQTITNNIDLSGEGGLVWIKSRTDAYNHYLHDTTTSEPWHFLQSNLTDARNTNTGNEDLTISAFNSDGFVVGSVSGVNNGWGGNGSDFASWTFRKAPKFFDVVTWTGDGTTNHSKVITHNLGSSVGFIAVKGTTTTFDWQCAHRSLAVGQTLKLNATNAASGGDAVRIVNDTSFSVAYNAANQSGQTYVAYLFAHNDGDGDFGPTGDQDVIRCGSYTGNGSTTGPVIDLGFEPQWILLKGASAASSWILYDTMRGMTVGTTNAGPDANLYPHSSAAEYTDYHLSPTPTGFQIRDTGGNTNTNGNTYIYMAIRRGPMAVPESATDVFDAAITTSGGKITTGFVTDMSISNLRSSNASYNSSVASRLTGNDKRLLTSSTAAEASSSGMFLWDYNDGMYNDIGGSNQINWMWSRAPSFCDVVAYTGDGTTGRTVSHNLGVAPEMIWVKGRDNVDNWSVYHKDLSSGQYLQLNATAAAGTNSNMFTTTAPTSSVFSLGSDGAVNGSSNTYIAYLFASLDGVSKVGSYTGDGTTDGSKVIDCGFSSGARFVLIKRTDGGGSWYVWDSERGIVAGNDPRLKLESTDAEDSFDNVDPHSSGFSVVGSSINNINGATYIFYAIA